MHIKQNLSELPPEVQRLVFQTLEIFVRSGAQGLAEQGLFDIECVPEANERCADYGGRFRLPPPNAPAFFQKRGDVYEIEMPLWLEDEEGPGELFVHLEVDPVAKTAPVVDILVP